MKLYKLTEWQSPTGRWHAANVEDLAGTSNAWWLVPRILGLSYTDYILLLKNKYHAGHFKFIDYGEFSKRNSLLLFDFEKHEDCHRFITSVNKISRNKNVMV